MNVHTALAAKHYHHNPYEPQHIRLQTLCSALNVATQRDTRMNSATRTILLGIVWRLDLEASIAERDAVARAKPRRVGLWCRVRNWWRAV